MIVLFSILDNPNYGKSISFQELLNGFNSPGVIFALNEEGLYNKLDTIVNAYKGITMSETAGIRELQLKTTFDIQYNKIGPNTVKKYGNIKSIKQI